MRIEVLIRKILLIIMLMRFHYLSYVSMFDKKIVSYYHNSKDQGSNPPIQRHQVLMALTEQCTTMKLKEMYPINSVYITS